MKRPPQHQWRIMPRIFIKGWICSTNQLFKLFKPSSNNTRAVAVLLHPNLSLEHWSEFPADQISIFTLTKALHSQNSFNGPQFNFVFTSPSLAPLQLLQPIWNLLTYSRYYKSNMISVEQNRNGKIKWING